MKHLHIIERRHAKARGMVRYFTAGPCKYGHYSERRTSVGHCVECLLILQNTDKWVSHRKGKYKEDRERVLEVCKAWRQANPAKKSETARAHYLKNAEYVKQRTRAWKAENPDRAKENDRRGYLENRAARRAQNKRWALENPDKVCAMNAARRARKLRAQLSAHRYLTDLVYQEASHLSRLREQRFGFPWEVDHMVPLSGLKVCGLHVWYNLEVIPALANARKGYSRVHFRPLQWLDLI